jgi:hypothetical protein
MLLFIKVTDTEVIECSIDTDITVVIREKI